MAEMDAFWNRVREHLRNGRKAEANAMVSELQSELADEDAPTLRKAVAGLLSAVATLEARLNELETRDGE